MTLPDGLLYLLFAAISLLSAAAAVVLTGYAQRSVERRRAQMSDDQAHDTRLSGSMQGVTAPLRYEFRDGVLLSQVKPDDPFLTPDINRDFASVALSEAMATLNPDLPDRMATFLARGEPFFVIGHMGPDALSILGHTGKERLIVTISPAMTGDIRALEAMELQSGQRLRVMGLWSDLQWAEDTDGRVVWSNAPYLQLCAEHLDVDASSLRWPLVPMFGDQLKPPPTDGTQRRCYLIRGNPAKPHWFEVTANRLDDAALLFSARPVDRLVTAETSLRDFVQTLSKTFATLPVGLAVFDQKRELVLFNPALVSVSRLDPNFLTRRPTLRAFLDQLREGQRMPEPRDYRSWREEIAVLEQGAEEDRYHEMWTLPSGETLRVTGRPHPNGAIAFVFEDISQEMSLTRRFRSDLELNRRILDDIAAGLLVVNRDGQILRTNAAYRTMLRTGLNGAASAFDAPDVSLNEMTQLWQEMFQPTGLWGDIRQFVAHEVERAAWQDTVTDRSERVLHCRIAPLKGGNTIIWFLPADTAWQDFVSDGHWAADVFNEDGPRLLETENTHLKQSEGFA